MGDIDASVVGWQLPGGAPSQARTSRPVSAERSEKPRAGSSAQPNAVIFSRMQKAPLPRPSLPKLPLSVGGPLVHILSVAPQVSLPCSSAENHRDRHTLVIL